MTTTCVAVSGSCLSASMYDREHELITQLQAGDEEAYKELVYIHSGALLRVARRFFGDTYDAAEAVQDTFISAYRAIGSFEESSRLGTWLHRIVLNACLLKLRRHRRSRCVPLNNLRLTVSEAMGTDQLSRAETCKRVRESVEQLPESYREVIQLRDLEGLNTHETALRLRTTEGVVKTRLHRARQAFRSLAIEFDYGI
jgi:RNA polymerase sigma-70 factor (ECF subfamily)